MTHIPIGSTVYHYMYGARMKKVEDGRDVNSDSLWKSRFHEMLISDTRVRLRVSQKDSTLKKLVEANNDG